MRAAAEAVIELLGRLTVNDGRFFVVERAAGDEVGAGLLERHVALDHVDDVDAIEQILNEGLLESFAAFKASAQSVDTAAKQIVGTTLGTLGAPTQVD